MRKGKPPCVERDAPIAERAARAVLCITDNVQSARRELDSNLVMTSRLQRYKKNRVVIGPADETIGKARLLPPGRTGSSYRPPVTAASRRDRVQKLVLLCRLARYDRYVLPHDRPTLQRRLPRRLHARATGKENNPRNGLVDAVERLERWVTDCGAPVATEGGAVAAHDGNTRCFSDTEDPAVQI